MQSGLDTARRTTPVDARKAFEREVAGHVDLVYAVSLRLTGDTARAEALARDALGTVIEQNGVAAGGLTVKSRLLETVRSVFVRKYMNGSSKKATAMVFWGAN